MTVNLSDRVHREIIFFLRINTSEFPEVNPAGNINEKFERKESSQATSLSSIICTEVMHFHPGFCIHVFLPLFHLVDIVAFRSHSVLGKKRLRRMKELFFLKRKKAFLC